jgi:hypothetical protein
MEVHRRRLQLGGAVGVEGVEEAFQVILGGVGAGIARPQQAGQRLASAIAAVQEAHQWVEPEPVLVGAGRALLVGVGVHQGPADIDRQQSLHVSAGRPGASAGVGPGGAQAGKAVEILGDLLQHPPGSGRRGDLPEQLRLLAQDRKIAQAIAAIGPA